MNWITVFTASGTMEAEVVKGLLESSGIRCLMVSNAAPSVHAFTFDGMGKVYVQVSPEDEFVARRLIAEEHDTGPDTVA